MDEETFAEVESNPAQNLVTLVEMLGGEEEILWEEAQFLLEGFPNWSRLLGTLQEQQNLVYNRTTFSSRISRAPIFAIPSETRAELHRLLYPYAVLVDERLPPGERAYLLDVVEDVPGFCAECQRNPSPVFQYPAAQVAEAFQARSELVRESARPAERTATLLRPAQETKAKSDALLQPASEPEPAVSERPRSFLQRLFTPKSS